MKLSDINRLWIKYKELYGLSSDVLIEELRYDAAKGVECSFDITELYTGHYILHLSEKFDIYRGAYVDYVLWHEFTHLYDFLLQPFAYKVLRKLYNYMNTYSEYHASRRALGMVLGDRLDKGFDPEKCVIPQPFKDISMRKLVDDTLHKAELSLRYYEQERSQQAFHVYLRFIMYLMGYASHFQNAENIISYCLDYLKTDREAYLKLYRMMQEKDFFHLLAHMDVIHEQEGLFFAQDPS